MSGSARNHPETKNEGVKLPPKTLPRSKGHHRDWLNACKGGPAASSNFSYGAALTEFILLGNVAVRSGGKIFWDSANMKATGAPGAQKFVQEEYRKGWSLEKM